MNSFQHGLARVLSLPALLLVMSHGAAAADYTGTCNVRFEGDSTLHAFTGHITNIPLVVSCTTNNLGLVVLDSRVEIAPRQLTTHHKKRDANMYKMFKADKYPKLLVVVTNAPLEAAQLTPDAADAALGDLPVQMTFCGVTKSAVGHTSNPLPMDDGWEFDLSTDVSLKAFQLKPASALFGAISVNDTVRVYAHVKVHKKANDP